jgi:antitoxin MazE
MKSKVLSRPRKPPKRGLKRLAQTAPGTMAARLVRIGNSRGVRLPKAVIEQAGLSTDVEIAVEDNQVVIRSRRNKRPRADWEERFKRAIAKHGPAEPMDPDWEYMPNEFDEKEWTG